MATSTPAVQQMAAAGGIPPVTLGVIARRLKEDSARKDWVASGKGGGAKAEHVEPHHLRKLMLALAAPANSQAVETAAMLSNLRYVAREVVGKGDQCPPLPDFVQDRRDHVESLGERLDALIDHCADPVWRESWITHIAALKFEIALCVAPAEAELRWSTSDALWSDRFLAPERELPLGPAVSHLTRRVVILPASLIVTAGKLWEDTLQYRSLRSQASGGGNSAGSRNENAAVLAGTTAPYSTDSTDTELETTRLRDRRIDEDTTHLEGIAGKARIQDCRARDGFSKRKPLHGSVSLHDRIRASGSA